MSKTVYSALAIVFAVTVAACSGTPGTPLSPSAATGGSLGANPDGSTLKIGAPTLNAPINGEVLANRRPRFSMTNAEAPHIGAVLGGVSYRLQLLTGDSSTIIAEHVVVQEDGEQTTYEATTDVASGTDFGWRARAELDGAVGPWSPVVFFRTAAEAVAGGVPTGSVGSPRNIDIGEAVAIIRRIYDSERYNIGRSSTRGQRNVFLQSAVAALHYGHRTYNPAGGDPQWCIKDGGAGRPQSDDVIVRCSTRDAWDLVLSIGGDRYRWHPDYIGRLPGGQNVYAPPLGALGLLH